MELHFFENIHMDGSAAALKQYNCATNFICNSNSMVKTLTKPESTFFQALL